MKSKVNKSEVIKGAYHQINANFITKFGETQLIMIIPMNLFDDEYAERKFQGLLVKAKTGVKSQYYIELISNLSEPGIILSTSQMISFESYRAIINNIITESHKYVKNVYQW